LKKTIKGYAWSFPDEMDASEASSDGHTERANQKTKAKLNDT
jgi:hypothetical protein